MRLELVVEASFPSCSALLHKTSIAGELASWHKPAMKKSIMSLLSPIAVLFLTACTANANAPGTPRTPAALDPQDAFWDTLSEYCGEAYWGRLVSDDVRDADWQNRRMIAHWADCSDDRIAIAFHVEDSELSTGWNRSRTWIITRTETGLRLKHDHRHEDGSEDAVTQYGGDTTNAGSWNWQSFPVDAESIAMFQREGLNASLTNVWQIAVDGRMIRVPKFRYQLTRENDPTRHFRVEFDLLHPAETPPSAWGW